MLALACGCRQNSQRVQVGILHFIRKAEGKRGKKGQKLFFLFLVCETMLEKSSILNSCLITTGRAGERSVSALLSVCSGQKQWCSFGRTGQFSTH